MSEYRNSYIFKVGDKVVVRGESGIFILKPNECPTFCLKVEELNRTFALLGNEFLAGPTVLDLIEEYKPQQVQKQKTTEYSLFTYLYCGQLYSTDPLPQEKEDQIYKHLQEQNYSNIQKHRIERE